MDGYHLISYFNIISSQICDIYGDTAPGGAPHLQHRDHDQRFAVLAMMLSSGRIRFFHFRLTVPGQKILDAQTTPTTFSYPTSPINAIIPSGPCHVLNNDLLFQLSVHIRRRLVKLCQTNRHRPHHSTLRPNPPKLQLCRCDPRHTSRQSKSVPGIS
jgi:hypothetical protein